MIIVYLASEFRNNFYLLHAVTSTWALSQLLPALDGERGVEGDCGGADVGSSSNSDSGSSSGGASSGTVNVDSKAFKMELVRVHLCTLLALYVTQKTPKLIDKHLVT